MLDFPSFPFVGQVFNGHRSSWVWDGIKWAVAVHHPRYVTGCFVPGLLEPAQILLLHPFSNDVTIPADFGEYLGHTSRVGGGTVALSNITIDVRKSTVLMPATFVGVGTITIPAGTMLGTFSSGGAPINFLEGDRIMLVAPGEPDGTFSDFDATIVGFET